MKEQKHCCEDMIYYLKDEDYIVEYRPNYNEYVIPVHNDLDSGIIIIYCPWCGIKLPRSNRDEEEENEEK